MSVPTHEGEKDKKKKTTKISHESSINLLSLSSLIFNVFVVIFSPNFFFGVSPRVILFVFLFIYFKRN